MLFFGVKKPYMEWDRVINSDGKGYYAYLPAIFIYQDIEYSFVEYYEDKYYPEDQLTFKEFRYDYKGGIVNKTFVGLTLLWLPFFLLAHLLTQFTSLPADGYSIIYQYAIGFATIFYFWLGLKFLKKILVKLKASDALSGLIIYAIVAGTNILYYTVYEGSMVHVYNFSLICLFAFFTFQAIHTNRRKWYILTSVSLALIIATRPQNGLIVFFIPFLAGNINKLKDFFIFLFKDRLTLIYTLVSGALVLSIPITFWYIQTGYFMVYSYGEEYFDFLHPHFFAILFSYNKGWFIYTPLAFFSMLSFVYLFKNNKLKFFSLLVLLVSVVYILSSWWCWSYCSRFSQRVFVDYLPVVAIMLVITYNLFKSRYYLRKIYTGTILLLIAFNSVQMYQHYIWVFPGGDITKEIYWDSFFRFVPKARINVPEESIIEKVEFFNDFEKDYEWSNLYSINRDKAFSGKSSVRINFEQQYSAGLQKVVDPLFVTTKRKIKVGAYINANTRRPSSQVVISYDSYGESYGYKAFKVEEYSKRNKWVYVEFLFNVPDLRTEGDIVKIYFWNPGKNETLFIDDIKVEFLSLKE